MKTTLDSPNEKAGEDKVYIYYTIKDMSELTARENAVCQRMVNLPTNNPAKKFPVGEALFASVSLEVASSDFLLISSSPPVLPAAPETFESVDFSFPRLAARERRKLAYFG